MIGFAAFGAFADGIISHDQRFNPGPLTTALICSIFLMARLCPREEKMETSAKERLFSIFLNPIGPPR